MRAALVEKIDSSVTSQPRKRRRRRVIPAAVALIAAIAGTALVIIGPGSPSPSQPGVAEARAILRGAAAGLVPPGAVLHILSTDAEQFPAGRPIQSRGESWQETSAPYDQRYIIAVAGGRARETAIVDGRLQLYDPQRNTIYTNQSPPPYTVRRTGRAGLYLLTLRDTRRKITITSARLRALRDGQDTIVESTPPLVIPYSSIATPPLNYRQMALSLLHPGHAQVRSGVQFAGQVAIEISGPARIGSTRTWSSYYVAPRRYKPLGIVRRLLGVTLTSRFALYQLPPGTVANRELVTLPGAHPSARIDTSATDWNAAANRLLR